MIESSCVGITFNPETNKWLLKTSSDTDDSKSTAGYVSYLSECVGENTSGDNGKLKTY